MKCSHLVLGLISLCLISCVSKSKYEEDVTNLKAEVEKNKAEIQKNQTELKSTQDEKAKVQENLIAVTKDRGQLKTSLEEMKQAMDEMRQRQAEERKRLKEFEDLTQRFKKLTDSGALSVQFVDGKMVVSLGSDVLFTSGSAKLSTAGQEAVKEVAAQLNAIPNKRYQVEGHTDNVPIATAIFPSNWELASARALNVTKSMMDAGMPASRISAASFGDTSPRVANDTPEGRAQNRRIAIVVVPDLSTLPGYEELSKRSTP
jgi:chemotaxis protein MotB